MQAALMRGSAQSAARRTLAVDADAPRARHIKQKKTAGNRHVLPEMNHHVVLHGRVGDVPEVVAENRGRDRIDRHHDPERPDLEAENQKQTAQCFDCDRPDPLKSPQAIGWLAGELGKTESAGTE